MITFGAALLISLSYEAVAASLAEVPFLDYAVHFGLEATGSLIAIFAYKNHRCNTGWHRVAIWAILSLITTVITVQAVG